MTFFGKVSGSEIQDDPEAWYNRGVYHRHLGHNQQAIADYTRAIELNPTFTWALINRGYIYLELNQYELAYTDHAGAKLYQGSYQGAIDDINQALRFMNPDSSNMPKVMQIRGQAYYGLGNYQQAIEDLSQAIAIHPTATALYYRGMAYQSLGQQQQADQDLDESTRLAQLPPSSVTTPTPAPGPIDASLGDTWVRPTDGAVVVYVPAGEFQMGSDDDEVDYAVQLCIEYSGDCGREIFREEEQPAHTVALDGFWIDRNEVTVRQYHLCVNAFDCTLPEPRAFSTADYDYPIIFVTWGQAAEYCAWAGARLPTEAEWEYAARGPEGRVFPWGDEFDGTRLNYCDASCKEDWADKSVDDGYLDIAPVASFPAGASWCGAYDLAGGVWEWVADWFGEYPSERQVNPTSPLSGEYRVARGGSWNMGPYYTRSATRGWIYPSTSLDTTGFRCVSASPPSIP